MIFSPSGMAVGGRHGNGSTHMVQKQVPPGGVLLGTVSSIHLALHVRDERGLAKGQWLAPMGLSRQSRLTPKLNSLDV